MVIATGKDAEIRSKNGFEDIPVSKVKIPVPVSLQSRRKKIKENKHNQ